MNNPDDIKALIPVVCPHCNNTLVVEFLIAANLLTPEMTQEILKKVQPVPPPIETPKEPDTEE